MDKHSVAELVGLLEAEVNNGGFHQFFFNTAGNRVAETIDALVAIGAKHTASIVSLACSKFPGGMPSSDRFKRQGVLLTIAPETDEFDDLDNAFYECRDDIESLVKSYKA
jgi:hypothetical protein